MQATILRIGTRGSPLALAQAHEVRRRLIQAHGGDDARFPIEVIRTSGDRIQDRPLSEAGGKGLFTKEIEEALLAGTIDLAVHSMKDVPTQLPAGLVISAVLEREDVRDAFISLKYASLADLPAGAVVGTSSLRRQAQVRRLRPDVSVVEFRGNVQTRLKKLEDGIADATFLARAGLNRLGLADRASAQGAVGIETRAGDTSVLHAIAALDHPATALCVAAERAFLARLEGSCRTPIGGLAILNGDRLAFAGEILTPDGREHHATTRSGRPETALAMAEDAADDLLARAGPGFFAGRT